MAQIIFATIVDDFTFGEAIGHSKHFEKLYYEKREDSASLRGCWLDQDMTNVRGF